MTLEELSREWAAPSHRIRRWCRASLLPAVKVGREWQIASDARPPPWRDGPSILALFGADWPPLEPG